MLAGTILSQPSAMPSQLAFSRSVVAALARHRHFEAAMTVLMLVSLIAVGYYGQWLTNRTRALCQLQRLLGSRREPHRID